MTIALVITTAISLALLSTGFLVTGMTERTKEIYLDRVEVMSWTKIFLPAIRTAPRRNAVRCISCWKKSSGVESVTYRNREQSYQRFMELFQDSDPLLAQETSKDALPAVLHVRLKDPLDTSPLDAVRGLSQVSDVIDQVEDLHGATENLDAIRNATFILAAVQAIAAMFLIVNMVQIAAFSRREEMSIMRMVGASRWFTQAPFVLEAVFAVLVGSLLAVFGLIMGKSLVVDKALESLYRSQLVAPVTTRNIGVVFPVVALAGMIFAAITAAVTLRLYVRK